MGMLPHRGLKEGSRSLGRDRLAVASARQWAVVRMVDTMVLTSSALPAVTAMRT